jgi:apolipoprotein N-acyltransferase
MRLARQYKQDLLIYSGYTYFKKGEPGSIKPYTSDVTLIQNGRRRGVYNKQILVPFFEYLPSSVSFLRPFMPSVRYFKPGDKDAPIRLSDTLSIATVLCYEAIFPEQVRSQVSQGAKLIFNPVSDTRFNDSRGGYYHLSLAYFRAIENRVPLMRIGNTGITAVIAADGSYVSPPTQINDVTWGVANITLSDKGTIYSAWGDWLTIALILVILVFNLLGFYSSKNRQFS